MDERNAEKPRHVEYTLWNAQAKSVDYAEK
jgi:hypothetical protein